MSPTRNRHRLIGLAAATLVAAAASPVTLAHAAPSATVSPVSVAPGGRVALNITGCGTKTGRATSRAFGDVQLTPGNLEASNLFGGATVYNNTPNGSYPVTFECGGAGGQQITLSLNVTSGAARGGLGGSTDSMSRGEIAIGGSLVAASLGAGVWIIRRRRTHPSA